MLLGPYLPRDGGGGSPYSEGGGLYALGLICANHGKIHRTFLLECLRAASGPVTQHGACLGLGALASGCRRACRKMACGHHCMRWLYGSTSLARFP